MIFFISSFWLSRHSRTWRMSINIEEVNCFWQFCWPLCQFHSWSPATFFSWSNVDSLVFLCRDQAYYSKWKRGYEKSIFCVIILRHEMLTDETSQQPFWGTDSKPRVYFFFLFSVSCTNNFVNVLCDMSILLFVLNIYDDSERDNVQHRH